MKSHRSKSLAVAATGLSVLLSASASAVEPSLVRPYSQVGHAALAPAPTEITDIALPADGTLCGQVADPSGQPAIAAMLVVRQYGQDVATTKTDGQGNFRINGLRGGVYQLSTGSTCRHFRLWVANSAPPTARQNVLLTTSNEVFRGQAPGSRGFVWWLTNPWILAAGVSAAIAVPIALSNNDPISS